MTDEQRIIVASRLANVETLIGVSIEHLEEISTGAITLSRMALKDDESMTVTGIRLLLGDVKRFRDFLDKQYELLENRFGEILESRPKSESETSQT